MSETQIIPAQPNLWLILKTSPEYNRLYRSEEKDTLMNTHWAMRIVGFCANSKDVVVCTHTGELRFKYNPSERQGQSVGKNEREALDNFKPYRHSESYPDGK